MKFLSWIKNKLFNGEKKQLHNYYSRYCKYAFIDNLCNSYEQYEASITRLYHTVEKGLSYEDYRPGFGKENINTLISSMNNYSKKYDINAMFYKTGLSVLYQYIKKNNEYEYYDIEIEKKIKELPGEPNNAGGVIEIKNIYVKNKQMNYKELMKSRHSIRHFTKLDVDINLIENALKIAQYTPSACNRQGWNTYIISDKEKMKRVLKNQNGNRGFGEEINKLLLITFDLRYSNRHREIFQAYIDGGMYAANILNALFYEGIGAVPLSASLTKEQEKNIRIILDINEAEVFILFVGLGNYPETCLTTCSERRNIRYRLI